MTVRIIEEWHRHSEEELSYHYISDVHFSLLIYFNFMHIIMYVRYFSSLECQIYLDLAYNVLPYKLRYVMYLICWPFTHWIRIVLTLGHWILIAFQINFKFPSVEDIYWIIFSMIMRNHNVFVTIRHILFMLITCFLCSFNSNFLKVVVSKICF